MESKTIVQMTRRIEAIEMVKAIGASRGTEGKERHERLSQEDYTAICFKSQSSLMIST